ncbi:hypothetical protein TREES_T100009563 [Tupaia chinensis]|uniref:Uncharacterized protein n=1 Tax=Tupaia chinensis TaxID=246437 RepID=L9LDP9_TUPCH|nr:hypothetical protein TREES_T100009563 [Tupaia chinensis]
MGRVASNSPRYAPWQVGTRALEGELACTLHSSHSALSGGSLWSEAEWQGMKVSKACLVELLVQRTRQTRHEDLHKECAASGAVTRAVEEKHRVDGHGHCDQRL